MEKLKKVTGAAALNHLASGGMLEFGERFYKLKEIGSGTFLCYLDYGGSNWKRSRAEVNDIITVEWQMVPEK
jgi:hypothetical protein